jgi:hypothetical protein
VRKCLRWSSTMWPTYIQLTKYTQVHTEKEYRFCQYVTDKYLQADVIKTKVTFVRSAGMFIPFFVCDLGGKLLLLNVLPIRSTPGSGTLYGRDTYRDLTPKYMLMKFSKMRHWIQLYSLYFESYKRHGCRDKSGCSSPVSR